MSASGFQSCVSIFGREPSLNGARYGLRGVRVGEASNPGPQSRVRPRREDVAEDLLSSLEFELTMLDSSDDEPFGVHCAGASRDPEGGVQSSINSRRFISISRYSSHCGRVNCVA